MCLVAALVAWFAPPLARGLVLYPHDNAAEVGLAHQGLDQFTRIFVDQANLYVPEVHAHLQGRHAGWLATWNPHNELGRPLFPCGLGRAWVVGHALSRLTSDALVYFTWSAIAALAGTAAFAFLFLRARGLHPLACLATALGLSIGPIFGGWQFVTLVQWGFCWALASLWGVELWLRRPSLAAAAWIVFSVHSVLMTGFPQHVLLLGWICASYAGLRVCEQHAARAARLRALGALGALAVAGVLSVAPMWADLYVDWRASTRADYTTSTTAWAVEPARRAALLAGLVSVPWRDDPGCQSLTLSPLFAGLLAVGLRRAPRALAWTWLAWLCVGLAGTMSSEANAALRLLGLSLSEWPPIYAALLPCALLAAQGAEAILRAAPRERAANALLCLAPSLLASPWLLGVAYPLDPGRLAYAACVALGTALLALRPRAWLLFALLATVIAIDGRALVRWFPRAQVQRDSPLAAELRERTADGSRFAWVGPRPQGFRFLQPNVEIVLGLSSVHGYDHLMSRAFSDWSRPLGTEDYARREYERRFEALAPHALEQADALSAAGVSTLISSAPLDPARVTDSTPIAGVHVASLPRRALLEARLDAGQFALEAPDSARAELPQAEARGSVERVPTGHDDRLAFRMEPRREETLLFVSQRHDPRWRASSGDRALSCVRINGLYQGILVPPGVDSVELAFRPWSRLLLPIQLGFVLCAAALFVGRLRRAAFRR